MALQKPGPGRESPFDAGDGTLRLGAGSEGALPRVAAADALADADGIAGDGSSSAGGASVGAGIVTTGWGAGGAAETTVACGGGAAGAREETPRRTTTSTTASRSIEAPPSTATTTGAFERGTPGSGPVTVRTCGDSLCAAGCSTGQRKGTTAGVGGRADGSVGAKAAGVATDAGTTAIGAVPCCPMRGVSGTMLPVGAWRSTGSADVTVGVCVRGCASVGPTVGDGMPFMVVRGSPIGSAAGGVDAGADWRGDGAGDTT